MADVETGGRPMPTPAGYRPAPRNLQTCPWTDWRTKDDSKVEGWLRARQDWREDVGSPLPPLTRHDDTSVTVLLALGLVDPAVVATERAAPAAPVAPVRLPSVRLVTRG